MPGLVLSERLVCAITLTSVEYCADLEGELRLVLCLTWVHCFGFPAGDTEKWRQSVSWRSFGEDYRTVQSGPKVCSFVHSLAWNSRNGPGWKICESTKRSWATTPLPCPIPSLDRQVREQEHIQWDVVLLVAGFVQLKKQAHIRSTQHATNYGEIIKKWWRDSKVGLHTNTGRI